MRPNVDGMSSSDEIMFSGEGANTDNWLVLMRSLVDELKDISLERFNGVRPFRASPSRGPYMCSAEELEVCIERLVSLDYNNIHLMELN